MTRPTSAAAFLAGPGAVAVLFIGAACGPTTGASITSPHVAGAVRVVAGENVWGEVTAQIGGMHVAVSSILTDPGTDPHSYETDPTDAIAVSRATIVIENGAGYDDFLAKEVAAAGGARRVLNIAAVDGIDAPGANPHLWYSPRYVTEAATAIEHQLATADPTDAAAFASGLTRFLTAYQPYIDTIAQIRARYAGTAVSYTERVAGYLVAAAGLRLATPVGFAQAVEDGTDPTPADTARFEADITGRTVAVVLYNSQVLDPQVATVKRLATLAGVPLVGMSETIPAQYATFQAWQIAQARALLTALGG